MKGEIEWTDDMNKSFEKLKTELVKYAILAHPDMKVKFIVGTDASNSGLGAWISQQHDSELKMMSLAFRSLSKLADCIQGFHLLKSIEASMPWDLIVADLVTPMSADGYVTMLVIIDIMTKNAMPKCLKDKTMISVARAGKYSPCSESPRLFIRITARSLSTSSLRKL